jgi:hypothetical protein
MSFVRMLFKAASLLTTAKILSSGSPRRIGKHLVRRAVLKRQSRWLRRL